MWVESQDLSGDRWLGDSLLGSLKQGISAENDLPLRYRWPLRSVIEWLMKTLTKNDLASDGVSCSQG